MTTHLERGDYFSLFGPKSLQYLDCFYMFVRVFFPPVFSPELEMTDSQSDDSSKRIISEVQVENPQIHKAPQYYAGKCIIHNY